MTTGKATESVPANNTAQHSRTLIRSIYRKRRPVWIVLAILVFIASLLTGLYVYPQSFTATTSLSLSSSSSSAGIGALLTGSGGGKAKYLGALKSRRFAEKVEKVAHLKDLYHLENQEAAVEKLQRGVHFDDNVADGLLYITMSLDAPAKMASDGTGKRKKVQNATAIVCNAYADALKDYIKFNDNDKELVLLRSADVELKKARAGYDAAVDKWVGFVRDSKATTLGGLGGSGSGGGGGQSPEIAAMEALFLKRGQLEVQIKSSDAAIAGATSLVGTPTQTLSSIPTEDVLLTSARRQYEEAQHDLQDLRIQYAETAPPILRAKERLQLAENHLHEQAQAIIKGHTSENIKRDALNVEYATVVSQIAEVERSIEVSKEAATSFEKLHAEVELSLRVLEATATRQAELKLQTVSENQRVFVVDEARPPSRSKPGVLMTVVISILICILAILTWFGIEFSMISSKLATHTVEPAVGGKQSEV